MDIEKIISEKKGTIVDVRTPGEFRGGNVDGSINIPLQELPQRMGEILELKQPVVFCCASGIRSGQAYQMAAREGIDCLNGGSWLDVDYYLT